LDAAELAISAGAACTAAAATNAAEATIETIE
jgi:hypothetical protein